MAKSRKKITLTIKIKDHRGIFQRKLKTNEKVTIGRHPDNDLVIYDDTFPKSFSLIKHNGYECLLNIHKKMSGEIIFGESKLSFHDLILQDILPQNGDFYLLKFSHGRKGWIKIGDNQLAFLFDGSAGKEAKYPGYNWFVSIRKTFAQDLLFKTLLILFITCELFWGIYIKNSEIPPPSPPEVEKVPERFAKFILKRESYESLPQPNISTAIQDGLASADEMSSDDTQTEGQSGQGRRQKPITSMGLLGLIGGSGSSDNKSATVDFLLDKGLIQELDNLINNQTLLKGKRIGRENRDGSTENNNAIEELLAYGLSGGVDDLIAQSSGVEKITLQKRASVNIQQPQTVRGNEQARGQRSAESVMEIVNSQKGHIMYTFNKYLRQNPDLRGKISLDITIAADGNVTQITVVESTIQNQNFIQDISNILRWLKFPAIPQGIVTVNLPFVFTRAG